MIQLLDLYTLSIIKMLSLSSNLHILILIFLIVDHRKLKKSLPCYKKGNQLLQKVTARMSLYLLVIMTSSLLHTCRIIIIICSHPNGMLIQLLRKNCQRHQRNRLNLILLPRTVMILILQQM